MLIKRGCRHNSVVLSSPTILGPGFESQAHHLCFIQFMLLKLLLGLKKNENKQKEAGIGPYFKRMFEQRPEVVFIEYL